MIPDTTLTVTSNVGLPWIPKDVFFFPADIFGCKRDSESKGERYRDIEIKIQKEGNGERDVCVSVPCRAVQRFRCPFLSYLGPLDLVKVTCQSPVVMWCDAPTPQVPVHLSQPQLARPISVLQILNAAAPPFRPVVPHWPNLSQRHVHLIWWTPKLSAVIAAIYRTAHKGTVASEELGWRKTIKINLTSSFFHIYPFPPVWPLQESKIHSSLRSHRKVCVHWKRKYFWCLLNLLYLQLTISLMSLCSIHLNL